MNGFPKKVGPKGQMSGLYHCIIAATIAPIEMLNSTPLLGQPILTEKLMLMPAQNWAMDWPTLTAPQIDTKFDGCSLLIKSSSPWEDPPANPKDVLILAGQDMK